MVSEAVVSVVGRRGPGRRSSGGPVVGRLEPTRHFAAEQKSVLVNSFTFMEPQEAGPGKAQK